MRGLPRSFAIWRQLGTSPGQSESIARYSTRRQSRADTIDPTVDFYLGIKGRDEVRRVCDGHSDGRGNGRRAERCKVLLAVAVAALTCVCAMPLCACSNVNTDGTSATENCDEGSNADSLEDIQKKIDALDAKDNKDDKSASVDTNATAESVAKRLPYIGMPKTLIDKTWLGAPDKVDKALDSGKWQGGTPYYWCAKNGSDDYVFSAIVMDDSVVQVDKYNMGTDYWLDPKSKAELVMPNRKASGMQIDYSDAFAVQTDPFDYDSPEEYADNAQKEFAASGSSDPWQDAYTYWEEMVQQ